MKKYNYFERKAIEFCLLHNSPKYQNNLSENEKILEDCFNIFDIIIYPIGFICLFLRDKKQAKNAVKKSNIK